MIINKHTIFLGIGSNVGNRKKHIESAVNYLEEKISGLQLSKLYETKPWGYKNQDDFLNAVIKGKTSLSSLKLFQFVKTIEKKVGRIKRFKWGPREIDIDILFYDNLIYKDKNLEIPHPRLHEREFVLSPLMDLDPDLVHPVFKKTIRHIRSRV